MRRNERQTNQFSRTEVFERSWPLNNENRTQQSPFIGNVAKKKKKKKENRSNQED